MTTVVVHDMTALPCFAGPRRSPSRLRCTTHPARDRRPRIATARLPIQDVAWVGGVRVWGPTAAVVVVGGVKKGARRNAANAPRTRFRFVSTVGGVVGVGVASLPNVLLGAARAPARPVSLTSASVLVCPGFPCMRRRFSRPGFLSPR
ncbi:uncharacterized protein K452DRAFT_340598 [Aplosporella prunicola CBS 121167]|uniref:Uncharacterized protein n=1 Tax=Aplosporella prunicola CBS 121167 TaxID=1176127 RepID=A0A6A6BPR0_9PEZI|nr:uncharacterized protein K452DRAFT_340598 [Aplosporella prunicola CBS 121167]KAF2146066.1 hypothetical protein K452DRAFT_340598 [Aplosporella prunicola CBS 121167]